TASYTDKDAAMSAQILNSIAASARENRHRIRQSSYQNAISGLLDQQSNQQAQVNIAQAKLIAYERENQFVATNAKY
ncbi:hypothetical protein ABTM76_20520, partial [Acinetobacter baumannii]